MREATISYSFKTNRSTRSPKTTRSFVALLTSRHSSLAPWMIQSGIRLSKATGPANHWHPILRDPVAVPTDSSRLLRHNQQHTYYFPQSALFPPAPGGLELWRASVSYPPMPLWVDGFPWIATVHGNSPKPRCYPWCSELIVEQKGREAVMVPPVKYRSAPLTQRRSDVLEKVEPQAHGRLSIRKACRGGIEPCPGQTRAQHSHRIPRVR